MNDRFSRGRVFTQETMTIFTLMAAFFIGFTYARLKNDEVLKLKMYTRYANFMWVFDTCSNYFETYSDIIIAKLMTFDSATSSWRARNSKIAEFWAWRILQNEIY